MNWLGQGRDVPRETLSVEKPVFIVLSPFEVRIAKTLGKERHAASESQGLHDDKVCEELTEVLHMLGAAGEIAYGKHMNLMPDLTVCVEGMPPMEDFRWHDGRSVDVKTTAIMKGNLIYPARKADGHGPYLRPERECDIYALMVGEAPMFAFYGHAYAQELFTWVNEGMPHGPAWFRDRELLWMEEKANS